MNDDDLCTCGHHRDEHDFAVSHVLRAGSRPQLICLHSHQEEDHDGARHRVFCDCDEFELADG